MTTLKVGDRVVLRGTVTHLDPSDDRPYRVLFDGEPDANCGYWPHEKVSVRKLTKRKPAPKADRVMVAARLLAGMLANQSGPIQGNPQNGWDYVNCSEESLSQVALELADALIAEGAK